MTNAHIRHAVFDWLAVQVDLHGDVLPRTVIQKGYRGLTTRVCGDLDFYDYI